MNDIIKVKNVNRIFPVAGGTFQALSDVTVSIKEGGLTVL